MVRMPNRRVAELEEELEAYKAKTAKELEKSWKEIEELEADNRRLRVELNNATEQWERAEKKLMQRGRESITVLPKEFSMTKGGIDGHSVAPTEQDSSSMWSMSMSATLESIGLATQSTYSSSSWNAQPSKMEKELMRQLEILQADKTRTVEELELKLRQREQAIDTLEKALIAKDATVNTLRTDLEIARAAVDEFDDGDDVPTTPPPTIAEDDHSDCDSTAANREFPNSHSSRSADVRMSLPATFGSPSSERKTLGKPRRQTVGSGGSPRTPRKGLSSEIGAFTSSSSKDHSGSGRSSRRRASVDSKDIMGSPRTRSPRRASVGVSPRRTSRDEQEYNERQNRHANVSRRRRGSTGGVRRG